MSKISLHKKKKHIRLGILYILASISCLYILVPYLFPIQLKEVPTSTVVYDRNNTVIGEILPDAIHRHQDLAWDMYPTFLINTIIAVEDKRFWEHNGIDIIALIRASIANIQSETITQ